MSTVVLRSTKTAAIGTPLRLRYSMYDAALGTKLNMTSYTVKAALKTQLDETTTYLIGPVTGTTGDGYVEVVLTEAAMETAAVKALAGETVWAETVTYLSGDVIDRIQERVQIGGRAIVPVAP
jgi:hypothetical protein